jgi:endonuclease/exonuclease/phosphatase family metal-dependent hydrolase
VNKTITVVSANLWHDWPRHRRLENRLEAFARSIEEENADILLLQEVTRTRSLRVDEWLAERLGMAYVYSRANGHSSAIGFEEGLAIHSRYALHTPQLKQLEGELPPFTRRVALGASVETPSGCLLVFSVHLSLLRRKNTKQLIQLRNWVAEIAQGLPALVGGDFNSPEHMSQIIQTQNCWLDTYRHLNAEAEGTTHQLQWPWGTTFYRHRLDYIFLKPGAQKWEIIEARLLDTGNEPHSDHQAVLTRLALTQQKVSN